MSTVRAVSRTRARRHNRIPPVQQRAYYTRQEVCDRFGFSSSRLKEAIANDETLPMMCSGKKQIFPKDLIDAWFQTAGARRLNIHVAPEPEPPQS